MSEPQTDSQIAVYIDFDNIVISRYDELHGHGSFWKDDANSHTPSPLAQDRLTEAHVNLAAIIDYAASFGTVSVARAYANWADPVNARYAADTMRKSIDLVQMFPLSGTKNGADIRLAIDVIDDLSRYSYLSHVLIVAGDSDYVSLAQRCKRLGRTVVGVGAARSVGRYWEMACDEFRYYGALPGVPATTAAPRKRRRTGGADPEPEPETTGSAALLRRAVELATQKSADGWTAASGLKSLMKRLDPAFDEKLEGHKSFTAYLRSHSDVVDVTLRNKLPLRPTSGGVTLTSPSQGSQKLILTAMIFAVAMTFIDQTIVSIAAPKIQVNLHLTDTGLQWAVNSYLLALAAFFAFGGRLADIVGHARMVVIGVITFAAASAMCGATPTGSAAEAWIVTFRAIQGIGGALMYPAALAIVIDAYPKEQRGRALALFFGIAGGLTAVGPALGGYLTIWTWRAIFWVNIPVALIGLFLIMRAKPANDSRPAPLDLRGAFVIAVGVALSVFGFQQSATWGWSNPATEISIVLGVLLIVAFVRLERGVPSPVIDISIFKDRVFFVQNAVLLVSMMVFVPVFFFASEYAQISLAEKANEASLVLLYFFAGFVVAAQIGGRMLDRIGARRPVVLGNVIACVGLILWAKHVMTLSMHQQVWFIVMTGAGMGLMLGQANTDALNRAPSTSYGEATGITQTVRNYAASLGLAILGTIQVTVLKSHVASSLIARGLPSAKAHHEAASIAQLNGGGSVSTIPMFLRHDFAAATQDVLYTMAAIMGAAAVVAYVGLPRRARHATPATEPAAV